MRFMNPLNWLFPEAPHPLFVPADARAELGFAAEWSGAAYRDVTWALRDAGQGTPPADPATGFAVPVARQPGAFPFRREADRKDDAKVAIEKLPRKFRSV